MLTERLKKRLVKDRPMTTITLRIPVDVVESLKEIAPKLGFPGYQVLLKSYISAGLRRDEAQFSNSNDQTALFKDALKRHGVPESILEEASKDLHAT